MDLAAALRGAALLTGSVAAGWAVARVVGRRVDVFAAVWWGLAVTSVAGVLLARVGWFSLVTLAVAHAVIAVSASAARAVASARLPPELPAPAAVKGAPAFAWLAGVATVLWAWPPFATFFAGADATMYLNAGVHLARTGSFDVPDTVARLLPPALASAIFPSVGVFGQGPFIRLSGGLLMARLDATSSTPAFFPLLPVWTAILAAVGGATVAPATAPLAMGLAVSAVTLFAGETLGLAAAIPTALTLIANFVVWWFGRFPMSEPLTIAFVWGGLVFLRRREPFTAGVMLGLGGLARTETLLFTVTAFAWWATWTRVGAGTLVPIAIGMLLASAFAVAGLLAAPSHHVAYLANDVAFAWTKIALRTFPALMDGRLTAAVVLLPAIPLAAGVVASWRTGALLRNTLRATVALTTIAGLALYLRFGDRLEPVRHLRWLATFVSPPGLLLAGAGGWIFWRRGGSAARLAVLLMLLVAVMFVPNPRVSAYQPWAMRRYLPILLPGLAVAVGAMLGALLAAPHWLRRAVAVALTAVVLALQLVPTFAVRQHDYFAHSLESVQRIAEIIPADGVAVIDSGFADVQIQVPLWLVYGREAVVATGGRAAWRQLLSTLVGAGRRVYWIQNRLASPPTSSDLAFTPTGTDIDVAILLPDAPADTPPTLAVRKLVPIRVYRVAAGDR